MDNCPGVYRLVAVFQDFPQLILASYYLDVNRRTNATMNDNHETACGAYQQDTEGTAVLLLLTSLCGIVCAITSAAKPSWFYATVSTSQL